jgi:hypothetical protein
MLISNNYNTPNFGAKFFHSESLKIIADHAVETGKFEKLNQARKNIDNACLSTRLRVDISQTDNGNPVLMIAKFRPKERICCAKNIKDYKLIKVSKFISAKKENPINFALKELLKLGKNAPNNKMYKKVVLANK